MVDHAFDPIAGLSPGQASSADGGERVAKVLARAGVASRRDVEKLIAAGRVALNGQVLDTPAIKVGPSDRLTVDGAPVGAAEATRVWRYHKPTGLVTTHRDPKGRATVFEHLPRDLPRVISIGRLDLNSEGLLLLTNDGALARALELPASGLVRRYRARARGHATQDRLDTLLDGLMVEGVQYGPIEARLDEAKEGATGTNLWLTVTLSEGKNREVRKVLEAIGLTVNRLIRLSYGPFQLGTLAVGEVEEIGPRVICEQLAAYIAPESLPSTARGAAPPRTAGASAAGQRRAGGGSSKAESAGVLTREATPKTEYKPGWAKPKKRVSHAAPSKPRGKRATPIDRAAEAINAPRPERPERTSARAPAKGAGPRPGPRRAAPKPVGSRPSGPMSSGSRPGGSKPGGSKPRK